MLLIHILKSHLARDSSWRIYFNGYAISGVVILGISEKSALLSVTSTRKKLFTVIESGIKTLAGLLLAGLGLLFLLASL